MLCGQGSWKVRGQDHATLHGVAAPDMIRQLPTGFALVIRGGCAPVIARMPRAWNNPAYRRARRHAPGLASLSRPFPLTAEPETNPDQEPDLDAPWEPGPDAYREYPPPRWATGHDDSAFPWR